MGDQISHVAPTRIPIWISRVRTLHSISAEVVFNEKDGILFNKWQREQNHSSDRIGYVLHGFEHEDFTHWRDGTQISPPERPLAFWQLSADGCHHVLHPVNQDSFRCPRCEINVCLKFQKALAAALGAAREQLNNADEEPNIELAEERFYAARSGWRYGRLLLAHAVAHHEKLAESESEWARNNETTASPPKILQEHTMTSAAAVDLAHANTEYQAIVANKILIITKTSQIQAPGRKNTKRVTFSDISEKSDERTPKTFKRTSSEYVPGKYSPRGEDSYLDTSGHRSDFASIRQLKMFVVDLDADVITTSTRPEGLLGMHKLWPQVREYLIAEEDGEMDDEADGLTVYLSGGEKVLGYSFECDQVNGDDEKILVRAEMGWTSMKQL